MSIDKDLQRLLSGTKTYLESTGDVSGNSIYYPGENATNLEYEDFILQVFEQTNQPYRDKETLVIDIVQGFRMCYQFRLFIKKCNCGCKVLAVCCEFKIRSGDEDKVNNVPLWEHIERVSVLISESKIKL